MLELYNWIVFGIVWIVCTVVGSFIDDRVGTLAGGTLGLLLGLAVLAI